MILTRSESDYRSDREQSAQMMLAEVRKNREALQRNANELNSYIESHIRKYFPSGSETIESVSSRPRLKFTENALKNNIEKQINYNKNLVMRSVNSMQILNNYLTLNSKLLVEVHKKYSIPFACIVFVLIGAPLGILTRRGGMAIGGGISLIFFLIYWLFLIGGEELADRRLLSPFWAMWIANILVGVAGIYLVIRTIKESTLIDYDKIRAFIRRK
ncbi:MAG: LptF/LptG family permease, partial [candidate division KSB1 bacterium]|jgi:lipopolysaccharide export system permease protein|nr:LptF/LptG family permease [candidate division KSB1 bacterium]